MRGKRPWEPFRNGENPLSRLSGKGKSKRPPWEESKSLLFNIPVQAMLVRETVRNQACTVLYAFSNNRLMKYILHLENSDTGTYASTRTHLEQRNEAYIGELFFHDEDVFVDKAGKTGVFLLKNERGDPILYFLDLETYASIKGQHGKKQGE